MSSDLPARPTAPGVVLRRELDARGWTQKDLAAILDRPAQVITEIIRGTKQITPETALELGAALGTPADLWTNLETAYRLQVARSRHTSSEVIARRAKVFDRLPIAEMIKRGWIRPSKDIDELDRQACGFLGVRNIQEDTKSFASCRRSSQTADAVAAQRAWVRRLEIVTSKQRIRAKFTADALRSGLSEIRKLAENEDDIAKVPTALNGLGVRFVVVHHLPKTRIDGAALLGENGPIVGLSLRYDRIDSFWFTLLHELAHLALKHEGNHLDLDILDKDAKLERDETQANELAGETLLSARQFKDFVQNNRGVMSRDRVEDFARLQKVHPGLVVGRMQFEGVIPYSHFRSYLVKISRHLAPWIDAP
jgi:HTH-type transcriptional regulator/antitoxin HigA